MAESENKMGITFGTFEIKGIDVSEFQGTIEWFKVAALDPEFTVIRIGYGKSTDAQFNSNWTLSKGIAVRIAYWYLDYYSNHNNSSMVYGMSDEEWGKAQAQYCWAQLLNDNDKTIVFLDIENGGNSYAPAMNTVTTRVHAIAKAFLIEMDRLNGMFNGIYTSLGWLSWFSAWFKDRPLWVAWYNEMMLSNGVYVPRTGANVITNVRSKGWTGKVLMWQYTSDGDVNDDGLADGITYGMDSKALDLNAWIETKAEWVLFTGGTVTAPIVIYPAMAVPSMSQNNDLWKFDKFGTTTIGINGCVITGVAAIASLYGKTINPRTLNQKLIEAKGYEGNNLIWDTITKIFPDITMDWKYFLSGAAVTDAVVDEVLASKRPLLVQVDKNPNTASLEPHWVVIHGKDEYGYIMMDTWDGFIGYFNSRYVKMLRTAVLTLGVLPVPQPTTKLKVIRTVYVRDVPIGFAGSQWIGTYYPGKEIVPLETVTIGDNIWVRVTPWSVVAKKYGGIVYLE